MLVLHNREEPLEPLQEDIVIWCIFVAMASNMVWKRECFSCFGVKDLIWPILSNGFLAEWEEISAANCHKLNSFPRGVEGGGFYGCIFCPVAFEWDHQKALGVWCNVWVSNIRWSRKEGRVCGEGTKYWKSETDLAEDWLRCLPWDEERKLNQRMRDRQ